MPKSVETQEECSGGSQLSTLWKRFFHSRDPELRTELIGHYMQFARVMAASLYKLRVNNAVAFDDYLQYARTGLLESVDRFDPNREVKFEAFAAIRIRGAILNGLATETEQAAQNKAQSANHLSERLDSIRNAEIKSGSARSLEGWVNTMVSVALGVLLTDIEQNHSDGQSGPNPYASVELLYVRKKLLSSLTKLSPREAAVIRMHYFEQEEFQLIAEQLNVSKGRVSQLHGQALEKLKRVLRTPDETGFDL